MSLIDIAVAMLDQNTQLESNNKLLSDIEHNTASTFSVVDDIRKHLDSLEKNRESEKLDNLETRRDESQKDSALLAAIKNLNTSIDKMGKGGGSKSSGGSAIGGAMLGGVGMAAKGVGMGVGLASLGFGIGGFFTGLALGDKAQALINTDMQATKKNMIALGEALSETPNDGLMKMGAIMAAGAFAKIGIRGALGMTAMGAGIGGFFAGIALGDKAGAMLKSDGSNIASQMKNFAEGLGAFDDKTLLALGAMMTAGALLGPVGATVAAAGMTALGAGIGGFFTGLAGVGDLGAAIGVDGSGIKTMMTNMAGGLEQLTSIEFERLSGLVGALDGLPTALVALLGASGLGSVAGAIESFFGGGDDDDIFSKVARGLKQFESLDTTKLGNLTPIAKAVSNLGSGLESLADVDMDDVNDALKELGETLAWAVPMFNAIDTSGMERISGAVSGQSDFFASLNEQNARIDQNMAKQYQINRSAATLRDGANELDANKNGSPTVIVNAPTQNTTNNGGGGSTNISGGLSITDPFDEGTRDW